MISIWNLFSGILKFAIALPPPSKVVIEKKADRGNFSSDDDSESLSDRDQDASYDRDLLTSST